MDDVKMPPQETGPEPPASTSRRVSVAMGWSVGAKLARVTIGIATSIVVVRSLGSYEYGVLSIVRTILTFLAFICGLGLGQALLRFMPEFRVKGDLKGMKGLFAFVLIVQLAAWVLFLALFVSRAGGIEALYRAPGLGFVLKVGVALILIDLVVLLLTQTLTSFYDVRLLSIYTTMSLLVTLGLTVVFLKAGHGVVGVLVAAGVSGGLLAVALLDRCALHVRLGLNPSFVGVKRVLRYSVPFAAIGLLNLITWRQSETLLLGYFRTPVEAGLFDLGYRIPQQALELVPGAVWPLLLATFAEVYSKRREALGDAVTSYYKLLFVLVAPVSIFGAAIAIPAISVLFGSEMADSGRLAQMFFLIFSVSFFSTPLSMALYVVELTWLNLVIYVCNAVVNVGLDLLLIPKYGLFGAVIPVGLVILASPFVYHFVLRRRGLMFSVPWNFIGRCYLASVPLAVFFFLAGYINSVPILLLACGGGVAVFWVSARAVTIFREEEKPLLRGLSPRVQGLVLGFFGHERRS
ncbi:MAG: oligosaccharide flippase family protein [Candidatus Eisenbacteria bacterium]